jgi:transcriptional regulator with XRE-family HTH domain
MSDDKIKLTYGMREYLRTLRNKNGIIAEDLSERIGKSQAWLAQIENGRLATIRQDDLKKILDILDSSIDEFETYFNNLSDEQVSDDEEINFTRTIYKILIKQFPNASKIDVNIVGNKISIKPSYEDEIE